MATYHSLTVPPVKAAGESNETVLLRKTEATESNPQFRKVVQAMDDPDLLEKTKIMYLITQLRLSGYRFERNGAVYDGSKAASHLLMKYSAVKDRIETAKQFIDYVANGSSMSGQPYFILDAGGNRYLSHDVLRNELAELEKRIDEIRKIPEEGKS